MANLVIDFAAMALMLLLGYLSFRLERDGLVAGEEGAASADSGKRARRWNVYPSRLIRQCGLRPVSARMLYWSGKIVGCVLLPLFTVEFYAGSMPVLVLLLPATLGFWAPDIWLVLRRRKRRAEIYNGLGLFIDLIVVYLADGRSLDDAIQQVAGHGLPVGHPLGNEARLVAQEIRAGEDRSKAFDLLALRTGVPALENLAAVLQVAHRTGAPIREALDSQSKRLRVAQTRRVGEIVNLKSVEAMLPMTMICFPMFLLLVLVPAAIQVMDVFHMIGELL